MLLLRAAVVVPVPHLEGILITHEEFFCPAANSTGGLRRRGPESTCTWKHENEEIPAISRNPF